MNEQELENIKQVLFLIEEKLNWGKSSDWKQRDFETLIDLIYEETKIQLSLSTLKRIWKLRFKKLPHPDTLNALVLFLGYSNWQDYKVKHKQEEKVHNYNKSQKKPKKAILFIVVVMAILCVLFITNTIKKSSWHSLRSIDSANIHFSVKSISDDIPNTAIFKYHIPGLTLDSLYIQQSWDRSRRQKVSIHDSVHTSIYYYPGYFNAKLIIQDKIIKEQAVYITTDGWQALTTETGRDEIPTYIPQEYIINDGALYLPPNVLKEYNVDLKTISHWTHFFNSRSFGQLSCDNLIFETTIKNALADGGLTCQQAYVGLHFEHGRARIPVSIPGCVSTLALIYNDYYEDGKKNDLSVLGTDMDKWQKLKVLAKGKQVEIYLNNELVKSFAYTQNSGKLKYLQYRFKGCGKVDDICLSDTLGNTVYEDDFSEKNY